ncbi:hypothetical protein FXV83_36600 [Bradyrhizobium hipponense]|uniref:Uncharacterized protein n=1 Tax=Bradyrhizobium hipponense TaxID=2605638 RepID=A0A5S4YBC8_9BRAD|nr:hypothetical protein [Bradyrhizobium hipponense]TYO61726.1 hypothetical protein FXV83_36600 [Bradyrhizobium hipponense]
MTTSANHNPTASIASNNHAALAASPRVKLSRRRIRIDHPDPRAGARLLADALGAVDRDALDGLLKQLVKASVIGQEPDEANLAFMISMMKSIGPRDSIEAMLAAQMVCVHVAAMRSAFRLACTDDIAQQESLTRALGRLVRIYPAQIEALSRYRDNGERKITVQNLSVQDGGSAFVGNVTQHASVIVSEPGFAKATMDAGPIQAAKAGEGYRRPIDAEQAATA